MHLERVIAALAPADVLRRAPVEIGDLAYDARAAGPGSLFFCVPGTRADGHDFAADAVANGAVALVVERPVDLDVPQLVVPDVRRAMAPVADEFFGRPSEELQVAGVTGTNGKTTTAFLLYSILAAAGRRPGLLGTIESRVGGERRPAIRTTPDGAGVGPDELNGIDIKLRGRFNAENALGALAASRLLGIDDDAIARGLEAVRGVPGRFESVAEGQPFEVIVDYSHKPEALESVLRTARELTGRRVICVFGCGGDRDRGKRPLMGRIASELADVAIVTSDNPRSEDPQAIIDEILAGVTTDVEVEPDRAAAIERALSDAAEGDVVLIAGKGHEQGQEFADRTIPFDDREVARDVLRRLGAAT